MLVLNLAPIIGFAQRLSWHQCIFFSVRLRPASSVSYLQPVSFRSDENEPCHMSQIMCKSMLRPKTCREAELMMRLNLHNLFFSICYLLYDHAITIVSLQELQLPGSRAERGQKGEYGVQVQVQVLVQVQVQVNVQFQVPSYCRHLC